MQIPFFDTVTSVCGADFIMLAHGFLIATTALVYNLMQELLFIISKYDTRSTRILDLLTCSRWFTYLFSFLILILVHYQLQWKRAQKQSMLVIAYVFQLKKKK